MSRRRNRKAHKLALLRIWYVQNSLKQRPPLTGERSAKRTRKAPKAGWAVAKIGEDHQ